MYEIQLSDSIETAVMPLLNPPLREVPIDNSVRVQTLDNNVYVDQFPTKRAWEHTWAIMDEDDFNTLKGFYDRQRALWVFPTLTITEQGISDVVVDFEVISPQDIINNCGRVEGVSIRLRETVQTTIDGSS